MTPLRTAPLLLLAGLTACAPAALEIGERVDDPGTNPAEPAAGSLVDVADDAGSFSTLLAAVDAAGLTETLDRDGPFTVFAPTDEAFAKLPEGTLEALLADVPALTDVLLYHVVSGEVDSAGVADLSLVETLQGSDVKVGTEGGVFVNQAEVVSADVFADNGVIHVVDEVLLPPGSIADIVIDDPQFSTLEFALGEAGLVDTLDGDGPFTVFAPTNDAFDQLPGEVVDALLADTGALTEVLLFHVTDEKLPAAAVLSRDAVATLSGEADVAMDDGGPTIAGAPIVVTDIPASNGVIHVISQVMIP